MRARVIAIAALLIAPLSATAEDPENDDCGSGHDAGDWYTLTPVVVSLPATCQGNFDNRVAYDTYLVELPEEGALSAVLAGSGFLRVGIWPAEGTAFDGAWGKVPHLALEFEDTRLHTHCTGCPQVRHAEPNATIHLPAGAYQVRVRNDAWSESDPTTMPYELSIRFLPFENTPDCHEAGDIPDARPYGSSPAPGAVTIPVDCIGRLDTGDVTDAYTFVASVSSAVNITLTYPSSPRDLRAYVTASGASFEMRRTAAGSLQMQLVDTGASRTWTVEIRRAVESHAIVREPAIWSYRLVVETAPFPHGNDCGTFADAPARDVPAPKPSLGAGVPCVGTLVQGDVGDAFDVAGPTSPSVVRLVFNGPPGAVGMVREGDTWARVEHGSTWDQDLYVSGREPILIGDARWTYTTAFEPKGYAWSWQLLPDTQNDCGMGHDAPSQPQWAEEIVVGLPCLASFPRGDWRDWYVVNATDGDFVDVLAEGPDPRNDLFLNGHWIEEWEGGESSSWSDGPYVWTSSHQFSYAERVGGPVRWAVEQLRWREQDYTIRVRVVPGESLDDCGSGHDADASRGEAVHLTPPATCVGDLTTRADKSDDYTVDLEAGDSLVVRLVGTSTEARAWARFLAPDGTSRGAAEMTTPGFGLNPMRIYTVPADVSGRWTIAVAGPEQEYTLDVLRVPGGLP